MLEGEKLGGELFGKLMLEDQMSGGEWLEDVML